MYHVVDRALQADKAIKILNVTDSTKFLGSLEEAQILNRCRHKHIVTINEANIFLVNGHKRVILDLEYISGGSVENALKSRWLSIYECVQYMRGALRGLQHAHSQGFLHRDIKPGNILLDNNIAKLSDFGLATDPGDGLVGSAKGYKTHLAPEFYNNKTTSTQTDVFAAGVTLFRMVSNISDWRAVVNAIPGLPAHLEKGTLIKKIGYETFIPKPIIRIIQKACQLDTSKRYKSVYDFSQQLDRLRFGIDWIRLSNLQWEGRLRSSEYSCVVDSTRNTLEVRKNGRRKNKDCDKFPTFADAVDAMNKYISKTTIEAVA